MFIQESEIINRDAERIVNDEIIKGIEVKIPTATHISNRLIKWAMSKKGNDGLKAIQMIMEQIDGKPLQKTENKHELDKDVKQVFKIGDTEIEM